jgi:protein phosphatase
MYVEAEERLLENRLSLTIAWGTDAAHHHTNYDSLLSVVPQDVEVMTSKGALFVVADGFENMHYILNHRGQEKRISQRVVREIRTAYYQKNEEDPLNTLVSAVKQANILAHQIDTDEFESGGSTCVAVILCGEKVYGVNVGKDRAYLMRQGQTRQYSQDHTHVAKLVREGLLTPEQARAHPKRDIITSYLGATDIPILDTFVEPIQDGDTWVLCTDGLHHFVTDEELSIMLEHSDPRESVERLILLAKEHGSWDDITVMVIKISLRD